MDRCIILINKSKRFQDGFEVWKDDFLFALKSLILKVSKDCSHITLLSDQKTFHHDMTELNILSSDIDPTVTEISLDVRHFGGPVHAVASHIQSLPLYEPVLLLSSNMNGNIIYEVSELKQEWNNKKEDSHWLAYKEKDIIQPFPSIFEPIFFYNLDKEKLINKSFQNIFDILSVAVIQKNNHNQNNRRDNNRNNERDSNRNNETRTKDLYCYDEITERSNNVVSCLGAQISQNIKSNQCKHIQKKETIYPKQQKINELAIVSQGIFAQKIKINNQEIISKVFYPGNIIGLAEYFQHIGYASPVVSVTDGGICMYSVDKFQQNIDSDAKFRDKIYRILSSVLQQESEKNLIFKSNQSLYRIAYILLEFAKYLGHPDGEGITINEKISRNFIAMVTGVRQETISRIFTQLRDRDIIRYDNHELIILDKDYLVNILYGDISYEKI